MMTTSPATTSTPSAADLEQQLRRQGFEPGAPAHITPMSRAVDAGTARRMRCPSCRKRSMGYKPFRRGNGYAALAVCPLCGGGEQL